MSGENTWLIATSVLGVLAFFAYLIGILKRKKRFDLNVVVPLLLSCAGSVAAAKMMFLAYLLPSAIQSTNLPVVSSLIDSASIFVGGFVFLVTTLYGVFKIIFDAYSPPVADANSGGSND